MNALLYLLDFTRAPRLVWRHRGLFFQMLKRNIVARYRGSVLGIIWCFAHPLMMLTVYTFVFGIIFKARWGIDTLDDNRAAFPLIMFCGMTMFSIFAESLNMAGNLIVQQTRLVDGTRKIVKITEVTGREGNQILLQDIFTFEQTGLDENGRVQGYHTATGNIPQFVDELRRSGRLNLDMSVFVPKQ